MIERNESALVVSQTRAEVRAVNEAVRNALVARGKLGGAERTIEALEAVDLTRAQKGDSRYYPAGAIAILNRRSRGAPTGSIGRVIVVTAGGVALELEGKVRLVPQRDLDHLTFASQLN